MDLILLGTGSPPPTPRISGHANGIVVNGRMYLVDAGRNVCRQIVAAGFPVQEVDHLLFTHFHSDHFTGFADFYITRGLFGAGRPLRVYGPAGLVEQHVERMLHYYEYDIEIRAAEGKPREGLEIETTGLSRGDSFEIDGIRIAVEKGTRHGNVDDILSYRFEADGRVIVIASDGSPTEALAPFAKDADVLLMHPCIPDLLIKRIGQTPHMAKIIAGHHASTEEIGRAAAQAGAKKVVTSHVTPPGTPPGTPAELVCPEIVKFYKGEIVYGEDLMRI